VLFRSPQNPKTPSSGGKNKLNCNKNGVLWDPSVG